MRFRLLCIASALCIAGPIVLSTQIAPAATPAPYDPWPGLVQDIFNNRPINDGTDVIGIEMPYRAEDAETIVIALGSVLGTIKDTIDELREEGVKIGAVGITSFRPFPLDAVRAAAGHARRVVVLEKALAIGVGGIVAMNVRTALSGIASEVYTVIAGLGGRAITKESLNNLFRDAMADTLEPLTFLDLNRELIERQLERERLQRRSGPRAENVLRDVGAIASRID